MQDRVAERVRQVKEQRNRVSDAVANAKDLRHVRNRGVARAHERLARGHNKQREDDRSMRLEALKVRSLILMDLLMIGFCILLIFLPWSRICIFSSYSLAIKCGLARHAASYSLLKRMILSSTVLTPTPRLRRRTTLRRIRRCWSRRAGVWPRVTQSTRPSRSSWRTRRRTCTSLRPRSPASS